MNIRLNTGLYHHHQNSITVRDIKFEKVPHFTYLEVNVNERENSHEKLTLE